MTGSKFLACYFAPYRPSTPPVRTFGSTPAPGWLRMSVGFAASIPLQRLRAVRLTAPVVSTPL